MEQLQHRHTQHLPVPSREPQHPPEQRQFAVDRGVRREAPQVRSRTLPFSDVAQDEIGRDADGAPAAEEAVEVRQPTLQVAKVLPPACGPVVRAEIGRHLVV